MTNKIEQYDFIWQGFDKSKNKSKGEIPAKTEVIARMELRRQGYQVTRIRKKSKPLFARVQKLRPLTLLFSQGN